MAKKSRPKKSASKVSKSKGTPKIGGAVGLAVKGAQAVGGIMGIGGKSKGKGGRRSKKRSALWYAKEVQRLRLKRKYQKEKMRL